MRLPLRLLVALLVLLGTWAVVCAAHGPLLHLPYYWDEAGYYVPAAYDFFRTGSLIPFSTLSNAHPPIPSLLLATSWKLFGFDPLVTRLTACLASAFALLAVWRLTRALRCPRSLAFAVTLLTGLYPVFFAQSSLAHADIFAAPFTLWALAFFLEERLWPALICFGLAALAKETTLATPLALAAWEFWLALRSKSVEAQSKRAAAPNKDQAAQRGETPRRLRLTRAAGYFLAPVLPLIGWYSYYYAKTGYVFGNPEYLHYNATTTMVPLRIAMALFHRGLQLTVHMNLFVPVLVALGALLLPALPESNLTRAEREGLPRQSLLALWIVIFANAIFFSIFGGALLTRYLLPVYPLVILLCVQSFWRRLRHWELAVALVAVAFAIGLFVNPPYGFAPEDNLEYATFIELQQAAIHQIVAHEAQATVLTAWPDSDALRKPILGYVKKPVAVFAIEDFTAAQIAKAAREPGRYDVALVFSTKYEPPHWNLHLGPWDAAINRRYFGAYHDLDPAQIAAILGGKIVWEEHRKGLWAAVLCFDRAEWAKTFKNRVGGAQALPAPV